MSKYEYRYEVVDSKGNVVSHTTARDEARCEKNFFNDNFERGPYKIKQYKYALVDTKFVR